MALANFGGERHPRLGRRLPRPRPGDRYFEKESPGLAPGARVGPRAPLRAPAASPPALSPRAALGPGKLSKGSGGRMGRGRPGPRKLLRK